MSLKIIKIRSNKKVDVRCPVCTRKNTVSLKAGTRLEVKCVACKWKFEFHHLKPYAKRMIDKMEKK